MREVRTFSVSSAISSLAAFSAASHSRASLSEAGWLRQRSMSDVGVASSERAEPYTST